MIDFQASYNGLLYDDMISLLGRALFHAGVRATGIKVGDIRSGDELMTTTARILDVMDRAFKLGTMIMRYYDYVFISTCEEYQSMREFYETTPNSDLALSCFWGFAGVNNFVVGMFDLL